MRSSRYEEFYAALTQLVSPAKIHDSGLFGKLLAAREELIEEGREEIRREIKRVLKL
jgi:hypothetical protein